MISISFISAGINAFTGAFTSQRWELTSAASVFMTTAGVFFLFLREKCCELESFAIFRRESDLVDRQKFVDSKTRGTPPVVYDLEVYVRGIVDQYFEADPAEARRYSIGVVIATLMAAGGLFMFIATNIPTSSAEPKKVIEAEILNVLRQNQFETAELRKELLGLRSDLISGRNRLDQEIAELEKRHTDLELVLSALNHMIRSEFLLLRMIDLVPPSSKAATNSLPFQ